MLQKAYVRFAHFANIPNNQNTYAAADGFDQCGLNIVPFRTIDDIRTFTDLGEDAIVVGNIADVQVALDTMGKPRPEPLDYPPHLEFMLGRKIERTTIEAVRRSSARVFVKPVQQKIFTGIVRDPDDPLGQLVLAPFEYDTEVFVSDIIDFVSEWRCFIKHHSLIGVKHYKGDVFTPPSASMLETAMTLGRNSMPNAYAIDLGIGQDGRTYLVEVNDGFALGAYGLPSIVYARFLEARWEELVHG